MKRGAPGFSLLEMLVVLAILGLAVGLVAGRARQGAGGVVLRGAAVELRDALRLARGAAIAGNRPVEVLLDAAGGQVLRQGAAPLVLPPGVVLSGPGRIQFAPEGGSSGGVLLLRQGERRMAVSVDWLTGQVRLADAP